MKEGLSTVKQSIIEVISHASRLRTKLMKKLEYEKVKKLRT